MTRERIKVLKQVAYDAPNKYKLLLEECISEIETASEAETRLMKYLSSLATILHKKHYALTAPNWELSKDAYGVLMQIDNMTTGLTRL